MECPRRLEEGVRSSGTRGTDICVLTCWCWERNPCPLEEQPVLLAGSVLLVFYVNSALPGEAVWNEKSGGFL